MPLRDWISNYPRVQALLQRPGEVLDYAPDSALATVPEGERPTRLYILVAHEPVAIQDLRAWARWLDGADRTVDATTVGGVVISTVFLAFDYPATPDEPLALFETIVSGGRLDEAAAKYATWDEAVAGHTQMVARVQQAEGEDH